MIFINDQFEFNNLFNTLRLSGTNVTTRGLKVKELINVNFAFKKLNSYYFKKYRNIDKITNYLLGELSWYFSGSLSINGITKYSKFWSNLTDNGMINSNYGFLVFYNLNKFGKSQFNWCVEELLRDNNSRRAIISYNNKDLSFANNKDFICTQNQHFMIRNNELVSIISIRSSDIIYGLTYDLPWFSIVRDQLWFELKKTVPELKKGYIAVNINSCHIYEKHFDLLENISMIQYLNYGLKEPIELGKSQEYYEDCLKKIVYVQENKGMIE